MKCFIDCETTGLRPDYHEIIELAIIKEDDNGKIIETYYTKVRPEHIQLADSKALEINGYNAKAWRDAPTFGQIAKKVRALLDGSLWIGHNPKFDYEFIQEALFKVGEIPLKNRLIDTTVLVHEHLLPLGCKGLSLDRAREFMRMDTSKAHTALFDTRQTRELYHKLNGCAWWQKMYWRWRAKRRGLCRW